VKSRHVRSAVLDTNLILLFLVGQADRTILRRYKRVQMFVDQDIEVLHQILVQFQGNLLTTPQVLTEVSNFLGQASEYDQLLLKKAFADYIQQQRGEIHVSSAMLATRDSFFRFGLTDCALEDASSEHLIITTDYRLAGKIQSMGRSAMNFNHARTSYLLQ
jgi:hypothetical protein